MISTLRNLWSCCLLLDHKLAAVSKTSLYFVKFVSLYFLIPIVKTHICLCEELGWCELPGICSKTQYVMNAQVSVYDWWEASIMEKKIFHMTRERKFLHYFSFCIFISHLQNLMFFIGCLMPYAGTSKWQEGRIPLMRGIWSEYRTSVDSSKGYVCSVWE